MFFLFKNFESKFLKISFSIKGLLFEIQKFGWSVHLCNYFLARKQFFSLNLKSTFYFQSPLILMTSMENFVKKFVFVVSRILILKLTFNYSKIQGILSFY